MIIVPFEPGELLLFVIANENLWAVWWFLICKTSLFRIPFLSFDNFDDLRSSWTRFLTGVPTLFAGLVGLLLLDSRHPPVELLLDSAYRFFLLQNFDWLSLICHYRWHLASGRRFLALLIADGRCQVIINLRIFLFATAPLRNFLLQQILILDGNPFLPFL